MRHHALAVAAALAALATPIAAQQVQNDDLGCLYLTGSTMCPGFEGNYIATQSNLANQHDFLWSVTNVHNFDSLFATYLSKKTGANTWGRDYYENLLGCNNAGNYTLQYQQTVLCNAFTQDPNSQQCTTVYLGADARSRQKHICSSTCDAFNKAQTDMIGNTTLCSARDSTGNRADTLQQMYSNCTSAAGSDGSCVDGDANEKFCGFGNATTELCAWCSGSDAGACCKNDDIPTTCKFDPSSISNSPSSSASGGKKGKSGLSGGAIAGIVIGVIAALVIAGVLLWFFMRRRNKASATTFNTPTEKKPLPSTPAVADSRSPFESPEDDFASHSATSAGVGGAGATAAAGGLAAAAKSHHDDPDRNSSSTPVAEHFSSARSSPAHSSDRGHSSGLGTAAAVGAGAAALGAGAAAIHHHNKPASPENSPNAPRFGPETTSARVAAPASMDHAAAGPASPAAPSSSGQGFGAAAAAQHHHNAGQTAASTAASPARIATPGATASPTRSAFGGPQTPTTAIRPSSSVSGASPSSSATHSQGHGGAVAAGAAAIGVGAAAAAAAHHHNQKDDRAAHLAAQQPQQFGYPASRTTSPGDRYAAVSAPPAPMTAPQTWAPSPPATSSPSTPAQATGGNMAGVGAGAAAAAAGASAAAGVPAVAAPSHNPHLEQIVDARGNVIHKSANVRVAHPYGAGLGDEITLEPGMTLQVLELYDDGWATGKVLSGGKEVGKVGKFPTVCVYAA